MKLLMSLLMFSCMNAFSIECDYEIHSLYGYACYGKLVDVANLIVSLPTGSHLGGRSDKDVKYLSVSNDEIESFPTELHKNFPNLETLEINFKDLKTICDQDLRAFNGTLKNLMVIDSTIEKFGKNVLSSLQNLKFFKLTSSAMKEIEKGAFDALELEKVQFNVRCYKNVDNRAFNSNQSRELIENVEKSCSSSDEEGQSSYADKSEDVKGTQKEFKSAWIPFCIMVSITAFIFVLILLCRKATQPSITDQNSRSMNDQV